MNTLTKNKNPWESMEISTQRRVDIETNRDYFWMTDLQGNYGFYLKRKELFDDANKLIRFKGISILERNSKKNCGELFLVLHEKKDWQIFLTLCEDLILSSYQCDTDKQMFEIVGNRLERWKNLLSS